MWLSDEDAERLEAAILMMQEGFAEIARRVDEFRPLMEILIEVREEELAAIPVGEACDYWYCVTVGAIDEDDEEEWDE